MATVPVELPDPLPVRSKVFDLMNYQQITPSGNGYIQTLERATPGWMAEYQSTPLRDERYNELIAFLDDLRGSENTFLAYDPRRPMPYAHRTESVTSHPWSTDGVTDPTVTGQDYETSTISLGQMKNGVTVTKGDLLSCKVGSVWYLFRALETKVAALNVVASLKVAPRPIFTIGAPVALRYRRACCEMKMIGQYRTSDDVASYPTISWRAAQFMDRSI